jgi:hypothetical protein
LNAEFYYLELKKKKKKEKEKENSHFGLAFCNWRG